MTSREKPEHRIAVLASGRGSNMLALARACADGRIPASICLVLSDVADAPALPAARTMGLESVHLAPGETRARLRGSAELDYIAELRRRGATLVCLAGFMRILGGPFLDAFPQAVVNIHPSLLPAFPGLDAIRRAHESGAKVTGASVHFVVPEVDAGPLILQQPVPIEPGDTLAALTERVRRAEHDIYPRAAALFCEGRLHIEGRKVRISE